MFGNSWGNLYIPCSLLVITLFFHLWWKKTLFIYQNVSECYEYSCLQNFFSFFMSLFRALIAKNSYILSWIYFIFLKNVVDQTWKAFNTKFGPQCKDRESSYQVRQTLALFLHISCSNFKLKLCQRPESYKNCETNQTGSGLGQVRSKKLFGETTIHKILETNSSFLWNSTLREKFNLSFSAVFC